MVCINLFKYILYIFIYSNINYMYTSICCIWKLINIYIHNNCKVSHVGFTNNNNKVVYTYFVKKRHC